MYCLDYTAKLNKAYDVGTCLQLRSILRRAISDAKSGTSFHHHQYLYFYPLYRQSSTPNPKQYTLNHPLTCRASAELAGVGLDAKLLRYAKACTGIAHPESLWTDLNPVSDLQGIRGAGGRGPGGQAAALRRGAGRHSPTLNSIVHPKPTSVCRASAELAGVGLEAKLLRYAKAQADTRPP